MRRLPKIKSGTYHVSSFPQVAQIKVFVSFFICDQDPTHYSGYSSFIYAMDAENTEDA